MPWPPFYETLMITVASVNIDIGWLRQPLNTVLGWISNAALGWSCNLGDMSAKVRAGQMLKAPLRQSTLQAAPSSENVKLSFGRAVKPRLVRIISKGGCQSHANKAHSSL